MVYIDENYYCRDCVEEIAVECVSCEDFCLKSSAICADDEWFCDYCASKKVKECYACEESFKTEDLNIHDNSHYYCDSCLDDLKEDEKQQELDLNENCSITNLISVAANAIQACEDLVAKLNNS